MCRMKMDKCNGNQYGSLFFLVARRIEFFRQVAQTIKQCDKSDLKNKVGRNAACCLLL